MGALGVLWVLTGPPEPTLGVKLVEESPRDTRAFAAEFDAMFERGELESNVLSHASVLVGGAPAAFEVAIGAGDRSNVAVLHPSVTDFDEALGASSWRTQEVSVTFAAGLPLGGGQRLARARSWVFHPLNDDGRSGEGCEPLCWSAELLRDDGGDDRFPIVRLSTNRRMFGPWTSAAPPPQISFLHEGRKVPFMVEAPSNSNSWIRLVPTEPVGPGKVVVRIGTDFPDPEGLPAERPFEWGSRFAPETVTLRRAIAEYEPMQLRPDIHLVFTQNDLSPDALASNLVVEPAAGPVEVRRVDRYSSGYGDDGWWRAYEAYAVKGAFRPGTDYTLRIATNALPTEGGRRVRIVSTNAVAFSTPAVPSALEWLDKGFALGGAAKEDAGLGLVAYGLSRANVRLRRVLPQNLVPALRRRNEATGGWGHEDWESDWCEAPRERRIEPFAPADAGVVTNVFSLDDFAAPGSARLEDGLWFVEANGSAPKDDRVAERSIRRVIARSDTAITARRLPREINLWATRLSTGEPVTNATFRLYGRNNEVLAEAGGSEQGLATIPLRKDAPDPWLVLSETPDGSYAFLVLGDAAYADELSEHPSEKFLAEGALDGFLSSDRGIYRHGERVFLEGLVRAADGAAPEPLPLVFELVRPDGTVVRRDAVLSDERGRVVPKGGSFELPDDQPGGTWRVKLRMPGKDGAVLAEHTLRVEAFVPPRIRVSLVKQTAPVTNGTESLSVDVRSDYFFGSPAAGLRSEVRLFASQAPFLPKGWDAAAWCFGADSRKVPETSSKPASGQLDANGAARIVVPLPFLSAPPAAALRLLVQGSVFELGGRAVSDAWSIPWHVYPFYLGVEIPESIEPGGTFETRVCALRPDGTPAAEAGALLASLVAVRHEWFWEKDNAGVWRWRCERLEEPVGDPMVLRTANGEARVRFRLPFDDRSFLLRVEPEGEWTSDAPRPLTEFAFSAPGGRGRNTADSADAGRPDRLEVSVGEGLREPGATAHLRLRSPVDGLALVTVQRDRVLEQRLVRVKEGEGTAELSIGADWGPSVEIAASVVAPVAVADEWPEHRAYGAMTLTVADPARRLEPVLGEPVAQLREGGGGWRVVAEAALPETAKAAGAHATFFLVDRAVLDLTQEPVPDPAKRFGRPRWSGASLYDTFRELLRLRGGPFAATAATGGDGGSSIRRRLQAARSRRFVPLAHCVADVPFTNGVARADFELPEFSGEARIVCLAWSRGATGAAAAPVRLAPGLVLEADGPRFLAPGDRTALSLSLHSTREEAAEARWSLELAGAPATNGVLALGPKGTANATIPIALAADTATNELEAVFRASAFGEDHVERLRLPVRSALPPATVFQTATLAPGAEAAFEAPAGVLRATHVEVRADPSPFAAFAPAVRWLGGYEWRCLEQTSSRAFPLLAAGGTAAAFAPGAYADPQGELEASVSRVMTMLRNDRFTLWPDGAGEHAPFGAWAGLFLAEAEAAGHALPASASTALRAALRRYARMEAPDVKWNTPLPERERLMREYSEARATALLGLRVAGEPDRDLESRLLDHPERLSSAGRACLSLVLLRAGRPEDALPLLRSVEAKQDDAAALAWSLLAWSETDLPETAERLDALRDALLRARTSWSGGSHWGTTRENALAAAAAAASARRLGAASVEAAAPCVALRPAAEGAAALPALTDKKARVLADASGAGALALRNEGAGLVSVERRVEGIADPATFHAATNGIAVSRRYFTPDGEELDPARGFTRGETVIVELSLAPWPDKDAELDQVIVDELLPAGLEPMLASDPRLAWIPKGGTGWIAHRETRDDRLILFSGRFRGPVRFHYAAQVVSAGVFALPPLQASEMYHPHVSGRTEPGVLAVRAP